jgi:tetratricopeptide (TPR) repeat protein
MSRALILCAIAAALVAGGGLYAVNTLPWWSLNEVHSSGLEETADADLAAGDWPICTASDETSDAELAKRDPDYAAGKEALFAQDWGGAIVAMKSAALNEPDNADIQNYIGYGYRRLREMEPAVEHYNRALTLDPRHRAAHEHLGEAYLALDDLDQAERHLARLRNLCPIGCEEYIDLKQAIAGYKIARTR